MEYAMLPTLVILSQLKCIEQIKPFKHKFGVYKLST